MSRNDWTSPADLRARMQRLWDRGVLLTAGLSEQGDLPLFPYTVALKRPEGRVLGERFEEAQAWIRELVEGSREKLDHGYALTWETVNHRQLGTNRVPKAAVIPSEADALKLLGKVREAKQFAALADEVLTSFPELRPWLLARPHAVLELAAEWTRILAVLHWFRAHPRSGLYLRQLDVPEVDTKFIEARVGLISELLDLVLPSEAVDRTMVGARRFAERHGLRSPPLLIRVRLLDPQHSIGGFRDVTVSVEELRNRPLPLERVLITENDVNALALPELKGAAVFFGRGYAIDRLAELEWLRGLPVHYWGDIDTHGFAILDRLRMVLPVESFLMDRETLLAHRPLWTREGEAQRFAGELLHLAPGEQSLFEDLRADRLGEAVRLEQERIAFPWVQRQLQALTATTARRLG